MKSFDELSDDFLNHPKKSKSSNDFDSKKDEFKNILKKLISGATSLPDEDIEKLFDKNLGKPDRIESFSEGDTFFEKRFWKVDGGEIVKVIQLNDPSLQGPKFNEKSIQKQLEEAVATENYELAAKLRDEIEKRKPKPEKKQRKPRLKKENKK